MTPKKYPQNLHTPKNIYFSENPKNIEIQIFDSKKMTRAYVCMKISEYPPGTPTKQVFSPYLHPIQDIGTHHQSLQKGPLV